MILNDVDKIYFDDTLSDSKKLPLWIKDKVVLLKENPVFPKPHIDKKSKKLPVIFYNNQYYDLEDNNHLHCLIKNNLHSYKTRIHNFMIYVNKENKYIAERCFLGFIDNLNDLPYWVKNRVSFTNDNNIFIYNGIGYDISVEKEYLFLLKKDGNIIIFNKNDICVDLEIFE